jgi:hypothetical protein
MSTMIKYTDILEVGNGGSVKVETHPNAPIIVNFYTVTKRGGKKYNTKANRMHFTNHFNIEHNLNWLNKMYHEFGTKVYYRAN